MAKPRDAICIIFDVGVNTNVYDKLKEKTFYDEAKICIESIVRNKIFTKPTDEISLFLMGTETTDNDLNAADPTSFHNISHAFDLKPMSWDILKYVQTSIDPPSAYTADWVDAIIVAMDFFRKQSGDDVKDTIVKGLMDLDIELIVVSKNIDSAKASFIRTPDADANQIQSERFAEDIVRENLGVLCNISEAVETLSYVDKKKRRRTPWKAELTIGSNLEIKIAAYIYVRDEKELDAWKNRFGESVQQLGALGVSTSSSMIAATSKTEYKHNDTVIEKEAAAEALIKGYMYGGEPIIFEDTKFENGGKQLKLIGFTEIASIKLVYLVGDTIWLVVPQYGADVSTKKFAALLKAMEKSKLAIIARYAYRAGVAPKLMALFPDEDKMLMYELNYNDSYVDLQFPTLTSNAYAPSDEQRECMDKFIDSMDLSGEDQMNVDDIEPLGMFDKLLDPGLQYTYRAMAHRAINPGEPMLKLDDDIKALITAPKKPDVEQLKTVFPLKEAKLTGKDAILQKILKADKQEPESEVKPDLEQKKYSDVHEVGTIKPADDFNSLLDQGEPFNVLSEQIEKVIVAIVIKSMVAMDDKVLKALMVYRETAKLKGPFKYNSWIPTFKEELKQREKIQLWQSLINEKLGLISANESEISTVTEDEVKEFYKFDDFNTIQSHTNNNDVLESGADLFDDM
ncbi:X-ray repair cross-complementing protein 5 [Contarinia nasturtii]|uniref:X-ray repair cross-complementing protein 5 n=1 Tax=Contarinia nasturtii TaxID=265458 RepID=UPI0012D3DB7A|nr:X-ray repair cross-complementing protein 5 [Contarinia nasturtii]